MNDPSPGAEAVDSWDDLPCGALTTSADGLILRANRAFIELSGRSREELVGRLRFIDLLPAGARIYHDTHYAPMVQLQGRANEIAFEIVRRDGARTPVLVNSVADGSGIIRTAVFEATDRRDYERELLRARDKAEGLEVRATRLAHTLQRSFLPPAMPSIPGLDVAGVYRPAGSGQEVGGDFYDVFEVGSGDWVVALGDVCGKGADAAVVTSLARFTLRAAAVRSASPSGMLAVLNEALLRNDTTDRFCTAVVIRLRHRGNGWTAAISCGGHPLPLLLSGDAPAVSAGEPGPLIGVLDRPSFTDIELPLGPGQTLLLYTDGVTEARSGDDLYGDARLHETASYAAGTAESVTEYLLRDVLDYQGGNPRDDIAIVTVRADL